MGTNSTLTSPTSPTEETQMMSRTGGEVETSSIELVLTTSSQRKSEEQSVVLGWTGLDNSQDSSTAENIQLEEGRLDESEIDTSTDILHTGPSSSRSENEDIDTRKENTKAGLFYHLFLKKETLKYFYCFAIIVVIVSIVATILQIVSAWGDTSKEKCSGQASIVYLEPKYRTQNQIHINQGKTTTSMIISWQTNLTSTPYVSFGIDPFNLDTEANPSTDNYSFIPFNNVYNTDDDEDDGKCITYVYNSSFIHHAELLNLKSNTTYYYRVGDKNSSIVVNAVSGDNISQLYNFTTLPSIGDFDSVSNRQYLEPKPDDDDFRDGNDERWSFAVIGDLGQTENSLNNSLHISMNTRVKMILHAGDLGYADCEADRWDRYGSQMEFLSSTIPWMVCGGNHEIEQAKDGTTWNAFETRYRMPWDIPAQYNSSYENSDIPETIVNSYRNSEWNDQPSEFYMENHVSQYVYIEPYAENGCGPSVYMADYNYGNSFYSFEAGPAHVIFLNPYTPSDIGSKQYKWLKNDFASINRTETPWVFVVMHGPWYNTNKHHYLEEQTVMMKNSMEELFFNNSVNMVFAGHVHAYERSYPVYKDQKNSVGPVYIVIGDGGNREDHASGYHPDTVWSAYRNDTLYGYGEIVMYNKTHVKWEWHREEYGERIVQDEVFICNSHPEYYKSTTCLFS